MRIPGPALKEVGSGGATGGEAGIELDRTLSRGDVERAVAQCGITIDVEGTAHTLVDGVDEVEIAAPFESGDEVGSCAHAGENVRNDAVGAVGAERGAAVVRSSTKEDGTRTKRATDDVQGISRTSVEGIRTDDDACVVEEGRSGVGVRGVSRWRRHQGRPRRCGQPGWRHHRTEH
jgi:hypothetical protein